MSADHAKFLALAAGESPFGAVVERNSNYQACGELKAVCDFIANNTSL
jgi:hypothetical protein